MCSILLAHVVSAFSAFKIDFRFANKTMTKKRHQSLTKVNVSNLPFLVLVGVIFRFGIIEVCGGECGSVDVMDPRISGGSETQRGEWPFIAALYYVEELKFFCGGTLITKQHVLTGLVETVFCITRFISEKNFQPLTVSRTRIPH